jgi:hypothetical protein
MNAPIRIISNITHREEAIVWQKTFNLKIFMRENTNETAMITIQ